MPVNTDKLIKSPEVTYDYDKKSESLLVTVELPGIAPDGYELNLATCGFFLTADTPDILYKGGYRFYHEVDADAAVVKFKNGTLSIRVPFFAPICGKQLPIDLEEED